MANEPESRTVSPWPVAGEAAAAVEEELKAARSQGRARRLDLGPVVHRPDLSKPPLLGLSVDTRGKRANENVRRDLYLQTKGGQRIEVDEFVSWVGDELVVRAAVIDPNEPLHLITVLDPLFVLESLARRLRQVTDPGLAADIAAQRLQPAPPSPPSVPGLNEEQAAALAATLSAGANLIWGPPGTGKTRVIVEALQRIVSNKQSALLVSNTNVAVDEALIRAWKGAGGPGPGVMIRVGQPALLEVGDHRWLPLEKACQHLGGVKTRRLLEIEDESARLQEAPELVALSEAEGVLQGLTVEALDDAEARLANERREVEVQATLSEVEAALESLTAAGKSASETSGPLRAGWKQRWMRGSPGGQSPVRKPRVEPRQAAVDQARAEVDRIAGDLDCLKVEALKIDKQAWRRRRRARRTNRALQQELGAQLADADERLARRERLRDETRTAVESAVAALRPVAESISDEELQAVEADHERARRAFEDAEARHCSNRSPPRNMANGPCSSWLPCPVRDRATSRWWSELCGTVSGSAWQTSTGSGKDARRHKHVWRHSLRSTRSFG